MGWFSIRPGKIEGHFTKKNKYLPNIIDKSVKKYLNKKDHEHS